jgi:hypothetical protein
VGEHEVETDVAVPAAPDGQPVEADEALEERQPCQEQNLQQSRVRAE